MIGSFITRRLLEEGYKVRALRRADCDMNLVADFEGDVEWIEGDVLDVEGLVEAMKGAEMVVHNAAIVSFYQQDADRMRLINVEGTANVVNACLDLGVKKLCHISSVAALGRSESNKPLDEKTKWEESEFNTAYARSKYLSELQVWRGVEEGLNAVVLNPSIVLGPGDWDKSSTKLFQQVWKNSKYYVDGYLNYVDVRDITKAVVKAFSSDISGERFVLNGGRVSYYDFYKEVAENFGRKAPDFKVSSWLLKSLARLGGMMSVFTGKSHLVSKETVRLLQHPSQYDSSKAERLLDLKYTSFEESISWSCKGLSQRYGL